MVWRDNGRHAEEVRFEELSALLSEQGTIVWVDLCEPTRAGLDKLADQLALDPHALEDSVGRVERPKAVRHMSHTFVTVYAARLETADTAKATNRSAVDSRLVLSRVSAFVLPRVLLTVRRDDGFDIQQVVQRWEDHADLLGYGCGALLHGLLDVVVDSHFDTIEVMDDAIESLEDALFDARGRGHELQQRTYRLRKELVELRRAVLPMREVVNTVLRHQNGVESVALDGWFTELYDHVLRASEWTESLRDMVTTVFETNLALQDARLNTVMKQLTAWAAIIAVPTAVTGWFGQNVAFPGFGHTSGLAASTVVITGLAVMLFVLFKRRGWI